MTKNEVVAELKRRAIIIDNNLELNAMERSSWVLFNMALAPIGESIRENMPWRDSSMITRVMTDDEFQSSKYDDVLHELFKVISSKYIQHLN